MAVSLKWISIKRGSQDSWELGGQDRVVVKTVLRKDKDVGLNPAATRNKKNGHWVDLCTEGAPIVQQDLSGRPAM